MPDDNAEVTVIGPAGGRVCIEISILPEPNVVVEPGPEPEQIIDIEAELIAVESPDSEALGFGELPTSRELDVLRLIAQGCTNRQTAEVLNISTRTVESHRANLMAKWNVNERAAFLRRGRELGLI